MYKLSDIENDHDRADATRIYREYIEPLCLDPYDKQAEIHLLVSGYLDTPEPIADNYVY